MNEPMRAQILEQPVLLSRLLDRRTEIGETVRGVGGNVRRIWTVGHGDSYFSPVAAGGAFEAWRAGAYVPMLAMELAAYPPSGLADDLVIAVSMSGGVGNTIAAARVAKQRGARVLAITNAPRSTLSEIADATIRLGIAEPAPFLAGTVTYTATTVVLMLIAISLWESPADSRGLAELAAAVKAMEAALGTEGDVRAWALGEPNTAVRYVLGMGPHVATAHYGAAKLMEIADVIGIASETEEFFHEQHWVMRPDQPVILLTHDESSRARASMAISHLNELEVPVYHVGPDPAPSGARHSPTPLVPGWCAPLPGAVAMQWYAYWLAQARGLDPNRRTHLRESSRYTVSRKYR